MSIVCLKSAQRISNDSLHQKLYFSVDLLALSFLYPSLVRKASHRLGYPLALIWSTDLQRL